MHTNRRLIPLALVLGVILLAFASYRWSRAELGAEPTHPGLEGVAAATELIAPATRSLVDSAQGRANVPRAVPPIFFRMDGAVARFEGPGRLVLVDGSGVRRESTIVTGSASLPEGIDPGELLFLLAVELDGDPFTYIDFDATWRSLVGASPVTVFPGEAVPARVFESGGAECGETLVLDAPVSYGLRVGAPEYAGIRTDVISPIALPFQRKKLLLELSGASRWAKFQVPEAVDPGDRSRRFERIELQSTFEIEFVLHTTHPISGMQFVAFPAAERRQRGELTRGTFGSWVTAGVWQNFPEGLEFSFVRDGLPAGRYEVGFSEAGEDEGLLVTPNMIDVGPGRPRRIEFWVDGPALASDTRRPLSLHFQRPVDDLVRLAGRSLNVNLTAIEGGLLAAGQQRSSGVVLTESSNYGSDGRTALVTSRGGFMSGDYDLRILPVGVGRRIHIGALDQESFLEIPRLGLIELRRSAVGEDQQNAAAGLSTLPRVTVQGYWPPTGLQDPVEAIGTSAEQADYLLAYGEYALTSLGGEFFVKPATFRVSADHAVVSFENVVGYSRALEWEVGGEPEGMPQSSLRDAFLLREGERLEGVIVAGVGLDFASGKMAGLRFRARTPGIYELEYHYVGSDGRDAVGRIEQFEIGVEELPPVPQELEP